MEGVCLNCKHKFTPKDEVAKIVVGGKVIGYCHLEKCAFDYYLEVERNKWVTHYGRNP